MHPVLRAAAERQWGLFTAVDARRAGYGHDEIRALCGTGRWVRLRRGVYTTPGRLAEIGSRRHGADCLAALLFLDRPGTAVSHGSAARLLDVPVWGGLDPTVRLTDPEQWRVGSGFRIACAPLGPEEVVRHGPFRLTSPARTLVDCAREWPLERGRRDGRRPARRTDDAPGPGPHRGGPAVLARSAGRPAGGRTGRRARRVPLETRGRLRILGAGLPTPELQVEIRSPGRSVAVVDAWFDDAAVAVESDGRVEYTDPWRGRSAGQVLWDEKRREDDLRALGIRVVRVAGADLGDRWPAVADRLASLLAAPGPAVRRWTATPRTRGRRRTA